MNVTANKDKFKDMDYETALKKLGELIAVLERGEGPLDELIEVYKEAFEYHAYCSEYLNGASEKIKELNGFMAGFLKNQGDM